MNDGAAELVAQDLALPSAQTHANLPGEQRTGTCQRRCSSDNVELRVDRPWLLAGLEAEAGQLGASHLH